MANGDTKEKARELKSISIIARPDWSGETTNTDKRYGDGEHKFGITIPLPSTDDESLSIYGIPLADLVEAGVIQKWYGARNVDNVISECLEKNLDPNSDEVMNRVTAAAAEQRFSKTIRVKKSAELKELAAEVKSSGKSAAELLAEIKEFRAAKAAGRI